MPPTNPGRVINAEHNAAQRIKLEREKRGWSLERTAQEMEGAGCPLASTAILKIERPRGPRRIQLDEAVAFAQIFDLTLDELRRPIGEVRQERLNALFEDFMAKRAQIDEVRRHAGDALVSLIELADDSSELDQMGERGRWLSEVLTKYREDGHERGKVRAITFPGDDMTVINFEPSGQTDE